tara:strand:+ start:19499 stop:20209 length:711 start_codon:yes stop_codon:yes gene_type:complete
MRYIFLITATIFLPSLIACETVDTYLGKTIDTLTGSAKSQLAAKPATTPTKTYTRKLATQSNIGEQAPAPSGEVKSIKAVQSRLIMSLRTLAGGTVIRRRFISSDKRYVEEDALWNGPTGSEVVAGMLLSESRFGPPISDATDPAGTVEHWATFRDKQRTFGDLIGSKNVLGPVLWRRSRIGTTTCVAFLQRWIQTPPSGPASTLSGFYCAAPGDTLSPGEAETVVQSLGLLAGSN